MAQISKILYEFDEHFPSLIPRLAGYPNPVSLMPPWVYFSCKERCRAATPSSDTIHLLSGCLPSTYLNSCPYFLFPVLHPCCARNSGHRGTEGSCFAQSKPSSALHSPFCLVAAGSCSRPGWEPGAAGTPCELWSRCFQSPVPDTARVSQAQRQLPAAPGPAPHWCTEGRGLTARRSLPFGKGWLRLFHGLLLWTPITLLPPTSGAWGEGRWKRAGECRGLWGTLGMLPASEQGSRLGHSPTWEVTSHGLEELSLCVCANYQGCTGCTLECLYINQGVLVGIYTLYLQTVGLIVFRDHAWINLNTFQRYWWWPNTARVQGI